MLLKNTESTPSRLHRGWRFVCREPLAQFALGGGLIFLAYWLWSTPEPAAIVISPEMAQAIVQQQSRLLDRPLSAAERAAAVAQYVDEELLVREAYKRGVDRSDVSVRERLADKMRFLLGGEPPAPTREQLRTFLKVNQARFGSAPFDDLAPTLKQQWVAAERDKALQQSLAELRKQYQIKVPLEAQQP
jgi:hypothetical protein